MGPNTRQKSSQEGIEKQCKNNAPLVFGELGGGQGARMAGAQDPEPPKEPENQVSKLKAEIEAKNTSVKELEEKVKKLEKEKRAIKKEFDDHKKDVMNLKKKYDETIEKVSELTNENTKLKETNDSIK